MLWNIFFGKSNKMIILSFTLLNYNYLRYYMNTWLSQFSLQFYKDQQSIIDTIELASDTWDAQGNQITHSDY